MIVVSGATAAAAGRSVCIDALALATISGSAQFTTTTTAELVLLMAATAATGSVVNVDVLPSEGVLVSGVLTSGVVARLILSLLPDLEVSFMSPPKTRPTRPNETVLCKLIVS